MFDWFTKRFRPVETKAKGGNPLTTSAGSFNADSGVPALAREELRHYEGEVYGNVRAIAQRIAGQPICVGRRTGKPSAKMKQRLPNFVKQSGAVEPIDDHVLLQLIHDPNALMVGWSLVYVTVAQLELAGLAYWWLTDGERGPEIWPLPPSWVRPEHDENRLFARYHVLPPFSGTEFTIDPSEVIRFAYPHPADPLFGVCSPLQAMSKTVVSDEQILTAQYRGHLNGCNPGLILKVGRSPDVGGIPGQRPILDKAQRAQLINAIKGVYRGAANNDEPFLVDGLIEDITKISNTPREMDFLSSGNMTRDRLSEGFGVNPIVRGRVEGANRASSAAADQHFCDTCVNPKAEFLSQTLTKHFSAIYGDELMLWIEPATSFDPDVQRADLDQLAKYGCLRKNELRSAHGLPPLDDEEGDDLIEPGPQIAGVDLSGVRNFPGG